MKSVARFPMSVVRFFGRLLKRVVLAVAGVGLLAALAVILDVALLRDRSGRPPA